MAGTAIYCTGCRSPLPAEQLNRREMTPCALCGASLIVRAFPAMLADRQAAGTGERVLGDEQASCFYHATKKAFTVCQRCGRFLCRLCDIDIGGGHLCPACVEAGVDEDAATELDVTRKFYDGLALRLAIWPLVVTPMAALFLAVRHWREPEAIVPRTRGRWIAVVVIAVAQLGGWALLLAKLLL